MPSTYTDVYIEYVYSCLHRVRIQLFTHNTYTAVYTEYVYSCLYRVRIHLFTQNTYTAFYAEYVYICLYRVRIQLFTSSTYTAVYIECDEDCISCFYNIVIIIEHYIQRKQQKLRQYTEQHGLYKICQIEQ